jgi:acyl dehydratase
MPALTFDDFHVGQRFEAGPLAVSANDIREFALKYDPQPFHLNEAAAKAHAFGGLIASGFHTLSLSFGLFFRLRLLEQSNLGSPGLEEVRWLKPLRPGDGIHIVAEVLSLTPSHSKPDRGVVKMRHDTFNQHGELIMTVNCLHMLKRSTVIG